MFNLKQNNYQISIKKLWRALISYQFVVIIGSELLILPPKIKKKKSAPQKSNIKTYLYLPMVRPGT